MLLPKELTTVTPLSKIIALFLFIILPIIGFALGMYYGSSAIPKGEKNVVLPNTSDNTGLYISPTITPSQNEPYTFVNEILGFKVTYPSNYDVVEAKVRVGREVEWTGDILKGDEIQKITFMEQSEGNIWPGEFTVSVLLNPELLSLEEWVQQYQQKSITETGAQLVQEVTNTTLAGLPAKEMDVFGFDHSDAAIVTIHKGLIYMVRYNKGNPNDPSFASHQEQYAEIRKSFSFFERNE